MKERTGKEEGGGIKEAEPYSQAQAEVVEYIPFKKMNFEQKVAHTVVSTWSTAAIVFSAAMFFMVGKSLYSSLFAAGSKQGLVDQSFEIVRDHELVLDALGSDLYVIGNRRGQASKIEETTENGKEFRRVIYYVGSHQGKQGRVFAKMQKNGDLNEWDFYYLIVEVPNLRPIHIVDRRPVPMED